MSVLNINIHKKVFSYDIEVKDQFITFAAETGLIVSLFDSSGAALHNEKQQYVR